MSADRKEIPFNRPFIAGKELDYIKRNIAGQNTTQAKGKMRRLSREVQAIEAQMKMAGKRQ